jgi:hypothetical protein
MDMKTRRRNLNTHGAMTTEDRHANVTIADKSQADR